MTFKRLHYTFAILDPHDNSRIRLTVHRQALLETDTAVIIYSLKYRVMMSCANPVAHFV